MILRKTIYHELKKNKCLYLINRIDPALLNPGQNFRVLKRESISLQRCEVLNLISI